MKLKPGKNTVILLSAVLIGIFVVTGGLWVLQSQAMADTQKKLEVKIQELNDGRAVAQRRDHARTALETDRLQLRYLEKSVSDAAYVPTLLKQIEDLAASTHNKVLSVRPDGGSSGPSKIQQRRDPEAQAKGEASKKDEDKKEAQPTAPYTPMAIKISLTGGFKSTQEFIQRLNRFPKIVAVDEVQIRPHAANKSSAPTSAPLLDIELRITAFVMKESLPFRPAVTASAAVGENIQ
jgi:Tfp pilus assembly protein PilO